MREEIHVKYKNQNWRDFLEEAGKRQSNKNKEEVKNTIKQYESGLKSAMRRYASDNCELLNECFDEYKRADSQKFSTEYYQLISEEYLDAILSVCKIMVITANPIEKAIFHSEIANSGQKICRIISGQNVYFIFKWGAYWVAHVHQGETGANKDMGANPTICDALNHFTPNVIISLGVAFGIDYTHKKSVMY